MVYENVEYRGTISEILFSELLTKENQPQLESPDHVYMTRVNIDQEKGGFVNMELFGEFGRDYIGREIRVVSSYSKPREDMGKFGQKVFVDGMLELDQEVVKRF